MDRDALRGRLADFLLATGRVSQVDLGADTPLITSGLINSVALFNLALWIEEVVGKPVDVAEIALPGEWDTMQRILTFIEGHVGGTATP